MIASLLSLKRDLMMLQQNSNRNDRYRRWMSGAGDSTRPSRLLAMISAFFFLVGFSNNVLALGLALILSVCNIVNLLRAKYKKPLVFTKRAIRIYTTSILLVLIFAAIITLWGAGLTQKVICVVFAFMAVYAVSYSFIIAANWLLQPVESRINKKYYDEAAAMLKSMPDLNVVGITGSYGKTSTKHYLQRILAEKFDVLMTPGNFNTTLGVIRTVREHLKAYNQVFIVEMGAKQKNDIKEICDLVRPQMGIITAVGPQHLESFKTIENVQATKFELADALPSDGLIVVNDDFEYIASRKVENTKCERYGVENDKAGNYVKDMSYTASGTNFTIVFADKSELTLSTKLVGRCNISNLMAAVIIARALGVEDEKIRYAVSKIEQVEHRLNIKHTGSGIIIIDDAYNSNPVGSAMALEVLEGFDSGKRIIITPGMIELGDDQYQLNKEFGRKIAKSSDVAIIVGSYNREAIKEGIEAEGMNPENIHYADTFLQAQNLMLSMASKGDVVLYENDLPDTFK